MPRLKMSMTLAAALMLLFGAQLAPAADPVAPHAADAAHAVETAGAHAAAATDGHAAPDAGSALLDPGGLGAVWNLALFLILLLILSKFVWPQILKGLQAREEKIRKDLHDAQEANLQARQTLAEYQKQLADAHAQARQLVEQARSDAQAAHQRLMTEAQTEAERLRSRVAQEIEQAKNAATQDLYARASELSVAVAQKILQRQITDADNQRLIEQTLAELRKSKAS
jgi:F-type H+-transporting ATPase subunit b